MFMKKFIFFLIAPLLFSLVGNAQDVSVKKVSPSKLERKLKKDIQLVDVRTEKEFNEHHIEKAVNINIEDENFEKTIQALDKSKSVYLYCRSGKRSDKAAQKMALLGFTKIYDLKGGILAWDKKKAKTKE